MQERRKEAPYFNRERLHFQTAIDMFVAKIIQRSGIPFDVSTTPTDTLYTIWECETGGNDYESWCKEYQYYKNIADLRNAIKNNHDYATN